MFESKQLSLPPGRLRSVLGIMLLATLTRLVAPLTGSHWNFAPMDAIALCSGAYVGGLLLALAFPLLVLFVSDMFINAIMLGDLSPLYPGWYWQYLAYILIVLLGRLLRSRVVVSTVLSASISASLLFFLLTNFGEWLSGILYPLTPAGLVTCFVAAIPFFHWTLVSDLLFSALLFGAMEYSRRAKAANAGTLIFRSA